MFLTLNHICPNTTHGKCSRVAYESGLYFSFNFSLSVDMGALWIVRD